MEKIIASIDWTAVVATLGTIGTTVMAYLRRKQQQDKVKAQKAKEEAENSLEIEKKTNEFLKENIYITKLRTLKQVFDLRSFSVLEKLQNKIFEDTSFDRLTVMFMMNGKVEFNFMSVIYDISKDRGEIGDSPYRKVGITDAYRQLITQLTSKPAWMSSEKASENLGELGEFIVLEEIRHIAWFRVKRIALDDYNDLLIYLSWSTEKEQVPSWKEKRQLEIITGGRLIPLLKDILSVPDDQDAKDLLEEIRTSKSKD